MPLTNTSEYFVYPDIRRINIPASVIYGQHKSRHQNEAVVISVVSRYFIDNQQEYLHMHCSH